MYQIYRGFGFMKETHCIPVLTVLLRGKDKDLYVRMWKKVDEAIQPLGRMHAKIANFDCEPAAWKSLRVQFPKVKGNMCVFDTKQAHEVMKT
uniref:MULE transposase domain-containing protein n=1 Tax=Ditylenchus dipsaci TaxID=166011 RepID=A0A915ERM5_9BILA